MATNKNHLKVSTIKFFIISKSSFLLFPVLRRVYKRIFAKPQKIFKDRENTVLQELYLDYILKLYVLNLLESRNTII